MLSYFLNLPFSFFQPTKNCDEIFDEHIEREGDMRRFVFLEKPDTSLFLFRPSLKVFKVLMDGLRNSSAHGNGMQMQTNGRSSKHYNILLLLLTLNYLIQLFFCRTWLISEDVVGKSGLRKCNSSQRKVQQVPDFPI